jgi:transcriptional regulator
MYLPSHFEETRTSVLHETMRANPFSTLVTLTAHGLDANHLPMEIDPDPAPYGTVRGHVARANPVWRDLQSHDVLAIFQGPHTYISPSWYPTAQESRKAVPTWNYVVVHAHGVIRIIDDVEWVRAQLAGLVTRFESHRASPWRMSDMPSDYVESLIRGVVGFEIRIARLIGKWKVSQNRPAADVKGIVDGLRATGTESDLDMAQLVVDARQDSTER